MAILDNIPGWKIFSTGIGIAALVVVGWLVYRWQFSSPSDLKQLQQEATVHALDQLTQTYVEKVRMEGEQRIVVMPVLKDTSNGQIRDMIIRRLNKLDGVKADVPRDPSLEERATELIKSVIKKEDSRPDPMSVFAKSAEADEVISVSVEKLWSGTDSGICEIDVVRIVREKDKAKVEPTLSIKGLSGTARSEPGSTDEDGPGFWSTLGGFLWRMLVVLAATAALPLLAWPGIRAALKADSNAMNGGLLVALTVADLVVLFALVSFQFSTTAVVCAGLLLPAALLYNFRIMNLIEER
ncbi:MAG: hypothetical protein KF754_05485 [Planctomycetes bacterium]|nr:hypothetical protein [Planctomycetota bacterium]